MRDLDAFHHVALTVHDRDLCAEWYARVLGFEEVFREEGDERRACVMRFAGGGFSVGLVEFGPAGGTSTDRFDPHRTGLDHLALACASREDLDEWDGHLRAQGVETSGVIDIPVGAILNFTDPSGIALAIFWDGPTPKGTPAEAVTPG
ncbi:VOC family protein [Actinomarinicola tropica]|uniref:VOC domain-containing protein n=1 Tax=Actinomarinicola tropica TaxID=2789776 RepID=A0A5Q2RJ71_9ACTN|nr:VOC family protein [Actinomarinicola tropica]QGG94436.1 hypothetical protein GH723_04565 [Actinomarinicola tropica]